MYLFLKNSLVKIKKSFGRFLSLFFIVALGLGFFVGVRSTSENMLLTADKYYDDTKLYDYKIASTYGLTEDDITSLKNLNSVKDVIGSYSIDSLVGSEVYRFHALEDKVNLIDLKKGRLPKKNNECLAENKEYKIGDIITLNKPNEYLKENSFKVVGLVETPMYISTEKGLTSIGNGKLRSFFFIKKDAFKMDYFTDAYIIGKNTKEALSYDKEYDKRLEPILKDLKKIKPIRETLRYEEVLEDATKEIDKHENKLKQEEKINRDKLGQGKAKIEEAKIKISKGFKEIENGKTELAKKEQEGYEKINQSKELLLENGKKYNEQLNYYNTNKDKISNQVTEGKTNLEVLKTNLDNLNNQIEMIEQNNPNDPSLPVLKEQYQTLLEKYNAGQKEIEQGEKFLNETPIGLEKFKTELDKGKANLEINEKKLKDTIAENKQKLEKSEKELIKSQNELNQNEKLYEKNLTKFNEEINKIYDKINIEKNKLNDLPKPIWYLLDRTDAPGYTDFKNDALRVENIAKIFPIFFLLVAALVCINTMTRMVEEDRTEIGVFKALGYKNCEIIIQYFMYVICATLVGGIFGLLFGYNLIPRAIYSIYTFTYDLPKLVIKIDALKFCGILLSALVLTMSVTWYACHKELKEVPANLLRPKPPKNGKKVVLEKINFIWKRINFSGKVTLRNIFRYKKRIFMTVIGIAGCTALTLTGFGLKDSISTIGKKQYENLFTYDVLTVLADKDDRDYSKITNSLKNNNIVNPIYVSQKLYNFKTDNKQHDFYLIVTKNNDELAKYVNLQDRKSKEKIKLNNDGAVITEKMATLLNAKVGDNIKIRNTDNELFLIKVADITENYTYHYVYMTEEYFKKISDKEVDYNIAYAKLKNDKVNYDKISTNLIDSKEFLNVNYTKDVIDDFSVMITSLNKIVFVILVASCLLALVVLYNLTIINIIERKRELATLKVLGFYDNEVSSYVYRETFLLTLIGIVVGLFLGVFLHRFVIIEAETDFILFIKEIKPLSYLYAILITLFFTAIIAVITHFKLKKIDMIESLKSVE